MTENIKLSNRTLSIISNFTNINSGILLEKGEKMIRVMKETKSVIGIASIAEEVQNNVAIYNVHEFLQCIRLFKTPLFDFASRQVNITDADSKSVLKYRYSEPSLITQAPKKNISMPEGVAVFDITSEVLDNMVVGANRLGLNDIVISAEGNIIYLEATNLANDDGNNFKMQLMDSYDGDEFEAHFNIEHFKLIKASYRVTIHSKITRWEMLDDEEGLSLVYYIATEKTSKF